MGRENLQLDQECYTILPGIDQLLILTAYTRKPSCRCTDVLGMTVDKMSSLDRSTFPGVEKLGVAEQRSFWSPDFKYSVEKLDHQK